MKKSEIYKGSHRLIIYFLVAHNIQNNFFMNFTFLTYFLTVFKIMPLSMQKITELANKSQADPLPYCGKN